MIKVKLGDVCEKASSNIAQKDLDNSYGSYPIYGASGFIKNVDFYKQDKEYIAVVKDGAGVGRTMLLPAYSSIIGTMQYILPNDSIDIKYLYYVLTWMNLAKYCTGATIPHIYFKDYKDEEFYLPRLEEQKAIADKLDKVSGLIEKRKTQLEKLDLLIKSRFIEMFCECEKLKRLEEYASLITKGASPKWQGIDYCEKGVLFVTSENVRDGYLDLSKRKHLDDKINEIQPRSMLKRNDILINIVGASIGRAAVYDCDEVANINQAVALVRVDYSQINQTYLMTFLNSPQAIKMYGKMKKGGARDNLSLQNIADLQIPVAPMELQNEFAAFVEQVDKSKFEIQKSLEKLEILKKSLMQQYFG